MNLREKIDRQVWLKWNYLRFLRLPVERRICLTIRNEGRFITPLLVALYEAGYGVYVVNSPLLFRELINLREAAPLPFIAGGPMRNCAFLISDYEDGLNPEGLRHRVDLDYDYFGAGRTEQRMPYFMHSSVYQRGYHPVRKIPAETPRRLRLGFFGTYDRSFYTRYFRLPMMNRIEVLDVLLNDFASSITHLAGNSEEWQRQAIALSMDQRGGDRANKAFLSLPAYLEALQSSDFFLSPPGFVMPFSHNLIEGMACGSIPLLNYPGWLTPPLRDGVDCLAFSTPEELREKIRQILAMPEETILRMRLAVIDYASKYLSPGGWAGDWLRQLPERSTLLVNNEEISIGLTDPSMATQFSRDLSIALRR